MKKIIGILIGVIVILVITVVVVISFIDVNQYKGDVISLVEKNTGRDFRIDGDLKFALSLIPTVEADGISFGNASWGSQENMLKVGRMEVRVSLLPLLGGTIQVNRLILVSPEILLETNDQGIGNWVFTPAQAATEPREKTEQAGPAKLPNLAVDIIEVTDARVSYRDGKTGRQTNLTIDDITIDGGGLDDPVSLTMSAAYNTVPVKLTGKLGAPELLIDNRSFPVQLSADINQATINIDGQVAKPLQAKGLNLKLAFHTDTLQSLSGITESKLPDAGPIDFSAVLTDSESGYNLKTVSLKLDKSDMTGDLSASLAGGKPALTADLASDLLDLAAFSGEADSKTAAAEKNPNAKVFPADPLPLASLHSADAALNLNIKKIHTKSADLQNVKLVLRLHDGKLEIKPLDAGLAGGTLQSSITLDGSNKKTATLALNVDIKNLQPGLLPDLQGKISDAKTSVRLRARGTGSSVAQIMANLNGSLLLQTDEGVYKSNKKESEKKGVLAKTYGLLNPEADAGQGTKIECLVVNLDIEDGLSTFDRKIALATDKIDVLGSGTLNFKTEQLDIGAVPQAREGIGLSAKQLAELVRLQGTFANPKAAPDTKAALKAGLSAGAAVATGGLSLLAQGLLNKSKADSDPCATALGKAPANKPAQEDQKSATGESGDTTKSIGDSLKDKLKGLFGR